MNFETAGWRRGALDGEALGDEALAQRRKRRAIIIGVVVAALVAIAAIFAFSRGEQAGPPADAKVKAGEALPTVTVVVPGRQQVARTITATGTLGARVDMPVGVAGEGGLVTRVLVQPGQWVGAGQTLAVIERSVQAQQVNQMQAQNGVTRADAALAQAELDRAQSLVSRGFVSKADIDRKTAARDAARARVRLAEAQLGEMRARLGRLDIRAPAAGLVLDRMVEPGQVVSAGAGALFRIAQGGQMEMLARLPESDLLRLSPGVRATITPVGSAQSFEGSVWQVSPIIDPQTRQGVARIAVPYNSALRPGGFASAQIVAGSVDAPLLPESAVQSDDAGNFVYIIDNKNEVARRSVKVGDVSDAGVAVIEGLNGTERVVLSAGAFLNPGDKVNPKRAPSR